MNWLDHTKDMTHCAEALTSQSKALRDATREVEEHIFAGKAVEDIPEKHRRTLEPLVSFHSDHQQYVAKNVRKGGLQLGFLAGWPTIGPSIHAEAKATTASEESFEVIHRAQAVLTQEAMDCLRIYSNDVPVPKKILYGMMSRTSSTEREAHSGVGVDAVGSGAEGSMSSSETTAREARCGTADGKSAAIGWCNESCDQVSSASPSPRTASQPAPRSSAQPPKVSTNKQQRPGPSGAPETVRPEQAARTTVVYLANATITDRSRLPEGLCVIDVPKARDDRAAQSWAQEAIKGITAAKTKGALPKQSCDATTDPKSDNYIVINAHPDSMSVLRGSYNKHSKTVTFVADHGLSISNYHRKLEEKDRVELLIDWAISREALGLAKLMPLLPESAHPEKPRPYQEKLLKFADPEAARVYFYYARLASLDPDMTDEQKGRGAWELLRKLLGPDTRIHLLALPSVPARLHNCELFKGQSAMRPPVHTWSLSCGTQLKSMELDDDSIELRSIMVRSDDPERESWIEQLETAMGQSETRWMLIRGLLLVRSADQRKASEDLCTMLSQVSRKEGWRNTQGSSGQWSFTQSQENPPDNARDPATGNGSSGGDPPSDAAQGPVADPDREAPGSDAQRTESRGGADGSAVSEVAQEGTSHREERSGETDGAKKDDDAAAPPTTPPPAPPREEGSGETDGAKKDDDAAAPPATPPPAPPRSAPSPP